MNTLSTRLRLVAAVALVGVTAPVGAQRKALTPAGWTMQVAAGNSTSLVSGDASASTTLRGPAGTVLQSLEFFEAGDRPCQIVGSVASWDLDASEGVEGADTRTVQSRISCRPGSPQRVSAPTGSAITGIQICQRRQNDRIKGARIQSQRLRPGGPEPSSGGRPNFERPNCNEWQDWVQCPQGQVATGAVLHSTSEGFVGLSLQCSEVTWTARAGLTRATIPTRPPTLVTTGNAPSTGVSGMSASEHVLRAPANMALRSLTYGERNDKPCYLMARFDTYNTTNPVRTEVFDRCNGNHSSERTVTIPSSLDSVHYASSIAVCQRQGNDRLKGIRLLGSRVDDTGARPDPAIRDEDERPNCNDWNPEIHCTQGQVVRELRIHYRPADNQPAEIVGLGANCATAVFR